MEDEKSVMSFDDAVKLLPDGDRIHTFRQGGFAIIGCDWDRAELLKAMKDAPEIEETGPAAQSMGHGLAIFTDGKPLFIETKRRES